MSYWVPYLALILFPFSVLFPFNVIAFSWGFRHGSCPMPPNLASKSERIDDFYGLWIRGALLLLAVLSMAVHYAMPISKIGLRSNNWRWNLSIGVGVSVLQICLQGFVWRLAPSGKGLKPDKRLLGGSPVQWVLSNILSVLAEELWIAFSYVSLKQTGHSTSMSIVLIGVIFGAAHYQYGPGAIAKALYGVVFASLFQWRGSLVPSYLVHYIGNVGALYWARRSQRRPRTISHLERTIHCG